MNDVLTPDAPAVEGTPIVEEETEETTEQAE